MFPMDLPRSAIIVLESLSRAGPMSPKDISIKANLAPRTTAFAIQRLMNHRLVKRVPNLNDMRQPLYLLNKEELKSMFRESGPSPLMRLVPAIMNWKRTA